MSYCFRSCTQAAEWVKSEGRASIELKPVAYLEDIWPAMIDKKVKNIEIFNLKSRETLEKANDHIREPVPNAFSLGVWFKQVNWLLKLLLCHSSDPLIHK